MNAKNDLLLFIIIFIGLGIVWAFSGGPERTKEKSITPPPSGRVSEKTYQSANIPTKTETAGDNSTQVSLEIIEQEVEKVKKELEQVNEELEHIRQFGESSPFEDKVTIAKFTSGMRATQANEEYITLRAARSNTENIIITGWQIESTITGKKRTIGMGSYLPNGGGVNAENIIKLAPGEKAIIITGRSPIGVSFKTNICTGYFKQFQNFTPRLQTSCPRPNDELDEFGTISFTDDSCYEFINKISRCNMVVGETPLLSSSCFDFLSTNINYNGCVTNHRNDDNFLGREWRIFLGRNKEQWREKREVIRLLDGDGRIVDVFTY